MLWLALYLPLLPLESGAVDVGSEHPQAVYETSGLKQTVCVLNAAAIEAGIEPGMSLGAARALCDQLSVIERNPDNEKNCLNNLALWAQQFTSKVSLQSPDGLLLEVGASLQLFQGLENLKQKIMSGLDMLGHCAYCGIAPTPGAAWLLALNREPGAVTGLENLNPALLPLSLNLLPITIAQKNLLRNLGLKSIGDCLRLPRDGLSRRLGPELLLYLDRALGRLPEPRDYYVAPDCFCSRVLLPEPVWQVEPLLFILQRLLRQLGGFLKSRDAGAQQLKLGFIMPFLPMESVQLTLFHPSHDADHLFKLWQEKLERYTLKAPVEGLELQVEHLLPMTSVPFVLFGRHQEPGTGFVRVLERLNNRLGEEVAWQTFCAADHRPEHARGQAVFPAACAQPGGALAVSRPVWLLAKPKALEQSAGKPYLRGPLDLVAGPERIESGWWDKDIRRDYYIARSRQHQRLWVFRDLYTSGQWFLHGFFS